MFWGGQKWPFLEKLKFYYIVDGDFFGFLPFFFVFFWTFLSLFWVTWKRRHFGTPFLNFFLTCFFTVIFYVFKIWWSFNGCFVKKGSKKWSKNGPKMVILGVQKTPFFSRIRCQPYLNVSKSGTKKWTKNWSKMVKNGFFGHFETYFWTILGFQSEGKKDDFMKIGVKKWIQKWVQKVTQNDLF